MKIAPKFTSGIPTKASERRRKSLPTCGRSATRVTKRRPDRAPEGSGVPVGTEYHWYIVAHQTVAKQTANDYTTSLTGLKFKIAHKRADSGKWSATSQTQRKRMIGFLRSVLIELESQSDRYGAAIAAREETAARDRTTPMSPSVTKRAKGRRPGRSARAVRGVRHGLRSKVTTSR